AKVARQPRAARRFRGGPEIDERGNPACGDRAGVQIALAHIALEFDQAPFLIGRFNSLSDDPDAEAAAEIDHGGEDGLVAGIDRHVSIETLVYLDDIDRELLEVAERGIPRAEILERDLDPAQVEQSKRAMDVLGAAAEEDRLGDLELEAT